MKGYQLDNKLYVFPQTPDTIPYVDSDVTVIYVQEENLPAWKEKNSTVADMIVNYNYNIMTVKPKEWAGHTNDDIYVPVTPELAWSAETATAQIGETNTFPTLTNPHSVTVTYSSSDSERATIDASTGEITLVAEGTTSISASFAGDDTYEAQTVTYTLTVQAAPSHDYEHDYFTIRAEEPGVTVGLNSANSGVTGLYYSTDGGDNWNELTSNIITLTNADDTVLFKHNGELQSGGLTQPLFVITDEHSVEGNIMSLLFDNFYGEYDLTGKDLALANTFSGDYELISVENLVLPATTLANECYANMFKDCTSLITAPTLPATTLATKCYMAMFKNCTSLTTAPELPATTLADYCYQQMFSGCTALTPAPELSATTLATKCYFGMYNNCTSLTTAPELPATTLANGCYQQMFSGCAALTTAPELTATTLTECCYQQMFQYCANLNYIKCLATDISATDCTLNWVKYVSSSGTFVKDASMSSWTTGNNGIPARWTVEDAPA